MHFHDVIHPVISSAKVNENEGPNAPSAGDMALVPLDGALRPAVMALAAGFRFSDSDWPDPGDPQRPVYESGVRLARGIVESVLGAPGAPDDARLAREAADHLERVAELAREQDQEPVALDGYEPVDWELGRTTAALREQAQEQDADVMVATTVDGDHVLARMPVTVAQSHVWLLEPLYEKLEAWAERDPLTVAERSASAWYFSRWRGSRPVPGDDFAGGLREQEFTFVDRPMLALDDTPLKHLLKEGLLNGVGPRQKRVAASLARSRAGVWTVDSRTEDRALFVSPDGTRHEVREHAAVEDVPYGPGFLAVGRLIPFGDGTWLRSPGTFLMRLGDDLDPGPVARTLAEGFQEHENAFPLPILLEAAVHQLAGVRNLPRAVPPAPTPDDAAELGRVLTLLLREEGIARPADGGGAEAAGLGARHPGAEVLEYDVDVVLGEYLGALFRQGQKSRAVRQARRRQARKARGKKGRGRR